VGTTLLTRAFPSESVRRGLEDGPTPIGAWNREETTTRAMSVECIRGPLQNSPGLPRGSLDG
jgi:hypothetical protein